MYAILDVNKNVIEVPQEVWAPWFENINNRIVKKDDLEDCEVSTVFLGIDHGFSGPKKLWFETMIFGGPKNGAQYRYETYLEALEGHKNILEELNKPKTQD